MQVKKYRALKEKAGSQASTKLSELDAINREQKRDQDRLDNEVRKRDAVTVEMQTKQHEQEENVKRIEKLNEYVR